jgi:metallophosphoesterase (TIGR00282 family)
MRNLRAIMIGDVVGDPGLEILERQLPSIIEENSADFVMVNGENAAAGFGLMPEILERLFAAGADVVSGGNHIWEKREIWPVRDTEERLIRPMNYPESPGKGWVKMEKTPPDFNLPVTWLAVNLQGREFMTPLDCPFKSFDAFEAGVEKPQMPVILVDFHAESSREKEALSCYLDGRVSVVAGTHTHVQTADERILPKGTAYITDLGMCGALGGVIGMDPKICLDRARNQVLYRMEVAAPAVGGKTAVQGIVVEIDRETRKAVSIKRI